MPLEEREPKSCFCQVHIKVDSFATKRGKCIALQTVLELKVLLAKVCSCGILTAQIKLKEQGLVC